MSSFVIPPQLQAWRASRLPSPAAFGLLEEALVKILAARKGKTFQHPLRARLCVAAAHNKAASCGCSSYTQEDTSELIRLYHEGKLAINQLLKAGACASQIRSELIYCGSQLEGTGYSSDAFSCESCSVDTESTADSSFLQELDCLLVGEIGIGNSTIALAMTTVLLGVERPEISDREQGLSPQVLKAKRAFVGEVYDACAGLRDEEKLEFLLTTVASPELLYLIECIKSALHEGIPCILDGLLTIVAAYCALQSIKREDAAVQPCGTQAADKDVAAYPSAGDLSHLLIASHRGVESVGEDLLQAMGLTPLLSAGLSAGEGCGALIVFQMLDLIHKTLVGAVPLADADLSVRCR